MRQNRPDPMNRIIALFVLVFIGLMLILIIMKPNRAEAECIWADREEAYAYMDSVLAEYQDAAVLKMTQRENEHHTREWEEIYGYHVRWNGDLVLRYVQTFGRMPTYDYPYADPLEIPVEWANMSIAEATKLAKNAIMSVESRLSDELLDQMNCLWSFELSRDLGWFWTPSGTWIINWWDDETIIASAYINDEKATVKIVFIYLDCHTDDPDDGMAVYTDF